MKVAALDLGTNSFLLLIQEKDKSGKIKTLHDESVIVRLGEGLQSSGQISEAALKRAEDCFKSFKKTMDQFHLEKVQAVTTAAARDASNAKTFLNLCGQYQIPVVILSGDEEARLSFSGALPDQASGKYLLIDIGGGSTEYVVGTKEKVLFSHSISHGAVKLTEKFIQHQPVPELEISQLTKQIHINSEKTWSEVLAFAPEKLIAVAGTPTAIAAAKIGGFDAEKINGMIMDQAELKKWLDLFASTSIQQKKDQYGLGARADVIFAGTVILYESLKRLGLKQMIISTKGIRYGLAHKLFNDL